MSVTITPKPCPAFSAGGEYCPWCGTHVGEYGHLHEHTPKQSAA